MPENNLRLEIASSSIIKVILFLVAAWTLYLLRDVFLILLTAIVIASAIEPLTRWFIRHGIARIFGVIIIYLTAAILLFGFIYFFIPSLVQDTLAIINSLPGVVENIEAIQSGEAVTDDSFLSRLPESFPLGEVLSQIQTTSQQIAGSALGFFGAVFGGILSFILIVIISFYLAVQEEGVANFLRIVTPYRYEAYVVNLWKRTQRKIGAWLQGQLILSVIVGGLSYIGLLLLGVPNALTLGLLAALFELIPLFGPILASIPAIALAFISDGLQLGLLVGLMYVVIQQFENHVFHPLVVKKVVGVPAIIVILSIMIGGQLAGFLGVILAVPLAAGLMEFISDIEAYKRDESRHAFGFGVEGEGSQPIQPSLEESAR